MLRLGTEQDGLRVGWKDLGSLGPGRRADESERVIGILETSRKKPMGFVRP